MLYTRSGFSGDLLIKQRPDGVSFGAGLEPTRMAQGGLHGPRHADLCRVVDVCRGSGGRRLDRTAVRRAGDRLLRERCPAHPASLLRTVSRRAPDVRPRRADPRERVEGRRPRRRDRSGQRGAESSVPPDRRARAAGDAHGRRPHRAADFSDQSVDRSGRALGSRHRSHHGDAAATHRGAGCARKHGDSGRGAERLGIQAAGPGRRPRRSRVHESNRSVPRPVPPKPPRFLRTRLQARGTA